MFMIVQAGLDTHIVVGGKEGLFQSLYRNILQRKDHILLAHPIRYGK